MTTTAALATIGKDRFFSEEQEKIIRDSFLSGAAPAEAEMLLEVARARRLNPLTRQIWFVKRWDSAKRCEVWAFQTSIDGFRVIAERTGQYDGQDEPEFEEGKDSPKLCKVRVYRKGISRPFVGVAYWDEYVQTKKEGGPNAMWARGKHFMLAKCAEAAALRKAFPEDLSGFFVPEEMESDAKEKDVTPAPKGGDAVRAALKAPVVQVEATAQPVPPTQTKAPLIVDVQANETEATAELRVRQESAKTVKLGGEFDGMSPDELRTQIMKGEGWLEKHPKHKEVKRVKARLEAMTAELATRPEEPPPEDAPFGEAP